MDISRRAGAMALLAATVVAGGTLAGGCSRDKTSPEQQVLRTIAQGLAAVERRSVDNVSELMADHYSDAQGNDRRRALGLLRIYFLQNQKIHLFAQTKSIRFPDTRTAEAVVVVAMAGEPIDTADAAQRLRANIYRFELRFVSDGGSDWRATHADWRYAELADLL